MATETININAIDEGWTGASGAATDIDEAIASADGNAYGAGANADAADFGLTTPAVVKDADTVTKVDITVRLRDAGTAGTKTADVQLLIGGTPQGSPVNTGALTSSFANYGPLNDAGWNSDWTLSQLTGAQVRVTPAQSGMPGTNAQYIDCADVIITYTTGASTFSGSDTVSLSEGFTKQTQTPEAETVSLAETFVMQVGKVAAETVSLAEGFVKQVGAAIADTVSLTENFEAIKLLPVAVGDAVAFTENLVVQVGKTSAETVALTEARLFQVGKGFADTVGLTEGFAATRVILKDLGDSLGITEIFTKGIQKQRTETVGLSENLQAVSSGGGGGLPAGSLCMMGVG